MEGSFFIELGPNLESVACLLVKLRVVSPSVAVAESEEEMCVGVLGRCGIFKEMLVDELF